MASCASSGTSTPKPWHAQKRRAGNSDDGEETLPDTGAAVVEFDIRRVRGAINGSGGAFVCDGTMTHSTGVSNDIELYIRTEIKTPSPKKQRLAVANRASVDYRIMLSDKQGILGTFKLDDTKVDVDEKEPWVLWNDVLFLQFETATQLEHFWMTFPQLRSSSHISRDLKRMLATVRHRVADNVLTSPSVNRHIESNEKASPKPSLLTRRDWPLAPLTPVNAELVAFTSKGEAEDHQFLQLQGLDCLPTLSMLMPTKRPFSFCPLRSSSRLEVAHSWPSLMGACVDETRQSSRPHSPAQMATPKLLSRRALSCELMTV